MPHGVADRRVVTTTSAAAPSVHTRSTDWTGRSVPPRSRMATAHEARRATPVTSAARSLIRCGRPTTPERASSSRSASVFTKWAPTPRSAVATMTAGRGQGWPGRPSVTNAGQEAERQRIGERADHRRLESQVVRPGRGDGHEVHDGRPPPGQEGQRHRRRQCGPGRGAHGADGDGPGHDRLVGAADGAVPPGVEPVVAPTGGQLPGQDGDGHGDAAGAPRPPGRPARW